MRCRGVGFGTGSVPGSAWIDRASPGASDMGGPEDVAQVTPKRLTEAMVAAAQKRGAELMLEQVVGVETEDAEGSRQVTAVRTDKRTIPCAAVVFAMGPWTRDAAAWLPDAGLPKDTVSSKYTSVVPERAPLEGIQAKPSWSGVNKSFSLVI